MHHAWKTPSTSWTHLSYIHLTSDDGTYSGTDEAKFLQQNMVGAENVTAFKSSCTGSAYIGTIMGQAVMIITSGIGPMQAQSCE